MVLLILAVIWAAALLPPLLRSRLEGNPVDSIGRFRRHLRVLESTTPMNTLDSNSFLDEVRPAVAMPVAWANEARRLRLLRRRRQVAGVFVATMLSTLLIGLLPGLHAVLVLHAVVDVVAVVYIALLVQVRTRETERQMAARFEAPLPADRAETYSLVDLNTQAH